MFSPSVELQLCTVLLKASSTSEWKEKEGSGISIETPEFGQNDEENQRNSILSGQFYHYIVMFTAFPSTNRREKAAATARELRATTPQSNEILLNTMANKYLLKLKTPYLDH
ncbi:hypothetical protein QQP08_004260 [Theobroma cacao]|nr:hypothetical protein QQP08_004260 [Theobroma cacao]